MKKKLLWGLLTLCLMIFLAPFGVKEVKAAGTAIYIGNNTPVTLPASGHYTYGDNNGGAGTDKTTIPTAGSDCTWWVYYDGVSYTLTLHDASIITAYDSDLYKSGIMLSSANGINMVLEGANSVGGTSLNQTDLCGSYGIYVGGKLTISGSGILNATAGSTNGFSAGMLLTSTLTINGGTINAFGGSSTGGNSAGICTGVCDITNGTVTATGGTASSSSFGMECSICNISGGTANFIGGSAGFSEGLYCSGGNITVSGSAVLNAGTNYGVSTSAGIECNSITVNGATVTAQSITNAISGTVNYSGTYSGGGYIVKAGADQASASIIASPTATTYSNNKYVCISALPAPVRNTTKDTGYNTLSDAVAAASSGDTIQMMQDTTLTSTVTVAKNLTLDLNGHTITGPGGTSSKAIEVNSYTLTIKDTSTGGKITNSYYVIYINYPGNLNLQNGTLESTGANGYAIYNMSSGQVNISGGTIEGNPATGKAVIYLNEGTSGTTVLNMTGGTVKCNNNYGFTIVNNASGTIDISGGTITKNYEGHSINNASNGIVNISGGTTIINTFSSTSVAQASSVLINNGTVNISGGTLTSYTTGGTVFNCSGSSCSINITGGTVQNLNTGYAVENKRADKSGVSIATGVAITGGLYPLMTTPTATTTSVSKTSISQSTAALTLTNSPAYTTGTSWSVYNAATAGSKVSGITATNVGNVLTLTYSSANLPAGDYYVAAYDRANCLGESNRLHLTVGDPAVPIVSSVSVPSNANYKAGTMLTFTVTFDQAVTVTGTDSTLGILIGSTSRTATYVSNSGNAITYHYIVQAGDSDDDGITVGTLSLNGSTITDSSSNAANLTLNSVASTSGVLVDTTVPIISSVAVSTTALTNGAVTVTVTATDTNGIAATNGYSFDGGSTWQTANTKSYSANTTIATNSIKVKDIAGNVASYATAVDITNIDITAPTISAINKTTASGPVTVTVTATDANGIAATNGYSFNGGSTWQTANTKTYSADATISAGSIKVKDTLGNIATYNTAMIITISTPSSGGGAGVTTTTPTTPGTIEKDQKREEGAPAASINNGTDTLKASVFTTTEQAKVAAGEDAKVILKIQDISTSVSTEDKKLVDDKIKKEIQNANAQNAGTQNTEQPSEVPAIVYVDISLYKQIGSEAATKVTQTSAKISISIEVPKELWNTDSSNNRTYRVVRVHDGVVEILNGTYDPARHLFTFETDRFSTYALTYQDTKSTANNTAGNSTDTTGSSTNPTINVYKDFYHLQLSAIEAVDTQTLNYAKVSDADGYIIYGAKCGKTLAKLADVKGTITSFIDKDLSKSTCYKYQVKAYKLIKGKKVIIVTSKVIYSYTTGTTYANPTKVTADVASVKLTVGKTAQLTCQVVLPKDMKLKQIKAVIRYESTDKSIATISSSGMITAKAKGTCYIYAYAQNGKYVKVKVSTL